VDDIDRNKTALTHRITAVAMGYLAGAGFKPIETEVPVAAGWIADIASFAYPTPTEYEKMKLNKRFDDDRRENHYVNFENFRQRYMFPITAIVEVKVSRSDYLHDAETKFKQPSPAHLRYLAFPKGMLEPREFPTNWTTLECTADGSKVWRVGRGYPFLHRLHPIDVTELIAQVAIRRHHRTEYHEMRAMMKAYRAGNRKQEKDYKLSTVLQIVAAWARGDDWCVRYGSLRAALEARNIKCTSRSRDLEVLERLRNGGENDKRTGN
jgi:hypothetical protein